MFREQYIRDNEKLRAKETLLMEIKQKARKNSRPAARTGWVRYGAVAAAILLVAGGVLGMILSQAGQSTSAEEHQSLSAARSGEAGDASPMEVTDYNQLYDAIENLNNRASGNGVNMAATDSAVEEAAPMESSSDTGSAMKAAAPEPAGGEGGSENYSSTNIQVEGVDEADIVKTDGTYLYYLSGSRLIIYQAMGKDTKLLSVTQLDAGENAFEYGNEMFLLGDRLMILAGSYPTVWAGTAGSYNASRTQALIYDISDRARPVLAFTLGQSGDYVSSRLIGDYVYVVTTQYVWQMARDVPETYVPTLYKNGAAASIAPGDISMVADPQSPVYTVIGAVNLKDGKEYAGSKALFGSASQIYCTQNHLLLALPGYASQTSDISPDEKGRNVQITNSHSYTKLVLFGLDKGSITRLASGEVPGALLNQFSMDEYKDVFRLVTTVNESCQKVYTDGVDTYEYEDKNCNALYTLDQNLTVLGSIEKLAENEWVQSVRFYGDVGYFVTFRQVDPLFCADLTDPKNPKILSALKIPGFSEYLQGYGDGLLLGIGYAADEESGATQGVKLSMFNITDPKNVTLADTTLVPATWTTVSSTHKCILADADKNLIAFPGDESYFVYRYTKDAGFTQLAQVRMNGDLNSYNLRGVYIGGSLYVLSESGVTVIDLTTFEKTATVMLAG
jgi:inhibitor of cysteine peptidase